MSRKHIFILGTIIIILFTIISIFLFLVDSGIIIRTTSNLLPNSLAKKYHAWDIIFGYKNNGKQIIEMSIGNIIGFISLIFGGLIVFIISLGAYRFLISFFLFVVSIVFTSLMANLANLSVLDWGDLLTIKPELGSAVTISLIFQVLAALTSGYLFVISFYD